MPNYPYWLGRTNFNTKWIGNKNTRRIDGYEKATGAAVFLSDYQLPGMLWGRVYTSPHAAAKIKSMDTSKAAALPGVRAVLRYDDPLVPTKILTPWGTGTFNYRSLPAYVLPGRAIYHGENVGVAIAADSLDIADEALSLVKFEWQENPHYLTTKEAMASNAGLIFPELQPWDPTVQGSYMKNSHPEQIVIMNKKGDPASNLRTRMLFTLPGSDMDKGFKEADKVIEWDYHHEDDHSVNSEPQTAIARFRQDGFLEIWTHFQGTTQTGRLVNAFSGSTLGLTSANIIEYQLYGGCQFGGLNHHTNKATFSQVPIAVLLAKKTNRPVKMVMTRMDLFTTYGHNVEGDYHFKVGYKKDGTITAVFLKTDFPTTLEPGKRNCTGMGHLAETCCIPNQQCEAQAVWVNRRPRSSDISEQSVNTHPMAQVFGKVAAELNMDPALVALKNDGFDGHSMAEMSKWKQAQGLPDIDSSKVCIEAAKKAFNFDAKWHAPGARRLPNGRLHGIGFSWDTEWEGGTLPPASGIQSSYFNLQMRNGKVWVLAYHCDIGVDHRTMTCNVIAEETGMNFSDVVFTRDVEQTFNFAGSTLQPGGSSTQASQNCWIIYPAAVALKKKILEAAATQLKTTADKLDIDNSTVFVKADPTQKLAVASVSGINNISARSIDAGKILPAPPPTGEDYQWARQVHYLEVEVDDETGQVYMTNGVAVNDVGTTITYTGTMAQITGGACHGWSRSYEGAVTDPQTGVLLNGDMIDYKVTTMLDSPDITGIAVESHMGYGPYGMEGLGECNADVCGATMPLAIYNATGVWVNEMPINPANLLKALGKA